MPWLSPGRWRKRLMLLGVTLLAGITAIVFAIGADMAIEAHRETLHIAWWSSLIIAPAGFALISWLTRRYFPGTEGSGIPQAIAASLTDDPRIRRRLLSFRIAMAKIGLTLLGLLAGASIGREGPSVQVGASMLNMVAGKKHGRIAPTSDLIVSGGGAGVAAAFNTPLGGIMFAIEELSRHRAFRANSTTLIAVIFAGLMSVAILGNYTYFGRTPAAVSWPDGLWPVLICGAAGGLLGGLFTRLLIASSHGLPGRMGEFARTYPVRFAAVCGLMTALVGITSDGLTWGTGYAESKAALEGSSVLPIYFMFAKALVIWIAFISGIPGGVFAPSLAVGAGIGANIALLLPGEQSSPILILGMVAFLAGITQSPITSFVIVMEMTNNHQMLLPLMGAAVVAQGFARSVAPVPLYDSLAIDLLRRLTREQRAMSAPPDPPETLLPDPLEALKKEVMGPPAPPARPIAEAAEAPKDAAPATSHKPDDTT
ncbi:MAG: chloride channel protein [Rhodocyclaceae bacterium]|nr:chloride channel protein [Rhodocyclaceae bacterium]